MIAVQAAEPNSLKSCQQRVSPGRKIHGIAAALLPVDRSGAIAERDFAEHLLATHRAGLVNAVNMDTGYVNLISREEKLRVLQIARQALGSSAPLVAGVYIEGVEGDPAQAYRREIDRVREWGAVPILFQTSATHGMAARDRAAIYREACRGMGEVLAFELGRMFAPNGEIWDEESFRQILQIPEISGAKHSSLSKSLELHRLEMRDALRPDFRIYTGNDLGINMVEFGSDYLLGLATFWPEAFARRDQWWAEDDIRYYELADALQYLGEVAFRRPVPAYKHTAAHFLHMRGSISSPCAYPGSPTRPDWEPEILRSCLERIEECL